MPPLLVVVLVVLIDLLGFSLVIPLLPRYGEDYGFTDGQIGLLLAAFPICQLVAGPILGKLSDRYGRRPVLVLSQLGTTISFVMLAMSGSFGWMLVARMLDGASGGNILVAQAYVADVTKPEDRAKGLGLIGAAFGVGFTLGPLLGGLILALPIEPGLRLRLPFFLAAAFSMAAWVLVLVALPEPERARGEARGGFNLRGLRDLAAMPGVGLLVGLGGVVVLAFAALEGTFSLYLGRRFGWGAQEAAYWFALFGVVSLVVQGGLIRRLVPRFGEARLIRAGAVAMLLGFVGVALARDAWALLIGCLLVATGYSLAGPSIVGLMSRGVPATEQGAVFGIYSSAQTTARIINYMVATRVLARFGPSAPFWEAAGLMLVAIGLAVGVRQVRAKPGEELEEPGLDGAGQGLAAGLVEGESR
jgi:DHA1 family tetracycline resistance protein-like MFS transporter